MINLGNVITAMVTPFKADLSVDWAGAEKLAAYLADNGSDGLVLHGTTGESPTLTHEEEYELYKVIKKAVGGKCKIIAGTGSNSTETTIRSTKKASEIGVDGIMLVVPYYNKPSQEGLYQHFKAAAAATSLPIILYNIPGRTGINMTPETTARLADIKNIVGLKDAAGSLDQTSAARQLCPPDFIIWSGDDSLTLPMMAVGATGIISVASHVAGKEIAAMVAAFHAGDTKKARELHLKLLPLFKVLFIAPNPAPVKYALELLGLPAGKPRLPLVEPTESEKERIKKVLRDLGLV
ncbi:4-hydroxy-tetrahydrodipicolinate synthase [candidate division WOR-1 bacterium RIFOXYA12_FULL_52_29]|uniref:4-hydroxy-tetrahydrodipicolinate synthase n=1 Tax=candidate division WOR-1 bacterium RIFOXYC12_FULL_54_18 TaxID=1802584 RepID=A0A1F4T577_UNCSA|nr:MAG: 4-hydroxy-tetrahydrodipicolinate synthase [candidate division WOR-1 bacterium RIFOXYA2_FULL_51_19]OGC17538.1 MAG: 4-hydroxy-tetrahydrodipicolinate synthase [candidate division WOR-1 bacterium RIFOXYA12_FULL_52_29]OGC26395.1 MAG: 4-hydroxy-tetrahydrodipicolinate synthase [candidate division WOR-1 bacterium RIFOXYB2_FULL_45_9]OGC27955.1 MAG: 4-hydroxy-tetrahydrodipicolinate synthase [candidate division WOR-1 bacterium RIFOXYC12_FULL_54_18]OGC29758.1 MAG: 4-hydroxy-tetrahydrodipicolinate s